MNISDELPGGIYHALASYSNVHRGSGHHSVVTTHLYEHAREIVLDYLQLDRKRYQVIFCTPYRCNKMKEQLTPGSYQILSSQDVGLPLGVRAIAIKRSYLKSLRSVQTGGGTTRLYSRDWVIWADAPDKFEPGTPAIIPVIAFARGLSILRHRGLKKMPEPATEPIQISELLHHDETESLTGAALLDKLRDDVIGRTESVPVAVGMTPFINFDNAASTRTFGAVWNTFCKTWRLDETSSQSLSSEVKKICSDLLEAPLNEYDIIFTSNTTESINLVASSPGILPSGDVEPVVLTTILEHSSNDLPWRHIPGVTMERLPVDKEGFWENEKLGKILRDYNHDKLFGKKRILMVAVSGASNVTGACNDLASASELAHHYGALLLADGAQLIAHRKVNVKSSGLDFLAFSAHKVYAPFGCGVLIARKGTLRFSEEEFNKIRASGEENTGGIAALGKSLTLLDRIGFNTIRKEEETLLNKIYRGMSSIPGLRVVGMKDQDASRRVGVLLFEIKNKMPGKIARKLASGNAIGVRYGCHCAHLMIKHLSGFTPFTENLQRLIVTLFPGLTLQGFVRISIGLENTEEDADNLLEGLKNIATPVKSPESNTILKASEFKRLLNSYKTGITQKVYHDFQSSIG